MCVCVCYGSHNKLIWWQCVSAIDPCVPHLVGTHTQPAVTAVQSGDHHTQQSPKHIQTNAYTHTHHKAWKWIPPLSQALHILITFQCCLQPVGLQSRQISQTQVEESVHTVFRLPGQRKKKQIHSLLVKNTPCSDKATEASELTSSLAFFLSIIEQRRERGSRRWAATKQTGKGNDQNCTHFHWKSLICASWWELNY